MVPGVLNAEAPRDPGEGGELHATCNLRADRPNCCRAKHPPVSPGRGAAPGMAGPDEKTDRVVRNFGIRPEADTPGSDVAWSLPEIARVNFGA